MDITNHLFHDITYIVLNYLNRDEAFRLLLTCNQLLAFRPYLYNQYYFVDKAKNNELVRKLKITKNIEIINNLSQYTNLHT